MNIQELVKKGAAFRSRLDRLKSELGPQPFEWYRYDSLTNLQHLDALLTEANRELDFSRPVLDIGCADGDLAFFLESLGCQVTAVDYPVTNHNHMLGVRKLKEALGSNLQILSMDVDSQFNLPAQDYGLAVVLGALYHLKNPFYLLEAISKRARTMLLSTRIARRIPGVAGAVKDVSVAYLLGDDELNQDNSNFWIFTESGFRQILKRTNWEVLDLKTFGDLHNSNPIDADHDERAFCLAQSTYALANVELLEGWHEAEGSGWRWTEQHFSVRVRVPVGTSQAVLKMKLYLPPDLLARYGSLTVMPGNETYCEEGYHELLLPLGQQDGGSREVRFSLNHAMQGDAADHRERGIIVHSLSVD